MSHWRRDDRDFATHYQDLLFKHDLKWWILGSLALGLVVALTIDLHDRYRAVYPIKAAGLVGGSTARASEVPPVRAAAGEKLRFVGVELPARGIPLSRQGAQLAASIVASVGVKNKITHVAAEWVSKGYRHSAIAFGKRHAGDPFGQIESFPTYHGVPMRERDSVEVSLTVPTDLPARRSRTGRLSVVVEGWEAGASVFAKGFSKSFFREELAFVWFESSGDLMIMSPDMERLLVRRSDGALVLVGLTEGPRELRDAVAPSVSGGPRTLYDAYADPTPGYADPTPYEGWALQGADGQWMVVGHGKMLGPFDGLREPSVVVASHGAGPDAMAFAAVESGRTVIHADGARYPVESELAAFTLGFPDRKHVSWVEYDPERNSNRAVVAGVRSKWFRRVEAPDALGVEEGSIGFRAVESTGTANKRCWVSFESGRRGWRYKYKHWTGEGDWGGCGT